MRKDVAKSISFPPQHFVRHLGELPSCGGTLARHASSLMLNRARTAFEQLKASGEVEWPVEPDR